MNTNYTPNLSDVVLGTCSRCGGPVTVPRYFWSVSTPTPECKKCGAVKKNPFGAVMDMEKSK